MNRKKEMDNFVEYTEEEEDDAIREIMEITRGIVTAMYRKGRMVLRVVSTNGTTRGVGIRFDKKNGSKKWENVIACERIFDELDRDLKSQGFKICSE